MRKFKRVGALIISSAMALGLLAGCGGAPATGRPGGTPGASAEGTGSVWRAERRKIDGPEGTMDAKAVADGKLFFSTSDIFWEEGGAKPVDLW